MIMDHVLIVVARMCWINISNCMQNAIVTTQISQIFFCHINPMLIFKTLLRPPPPYKAFVPPGRVEPHTLRTSGLRYLKIPII